MTYLRPVLPFLLLLILLGFSRSSSRFWRRTGILAGIALFLWAWPPFAWLLTGTLEWRYPATAFPAGEAEAIVVLSGGSYQGHPAHAKPLVALDTYLRCQHAAWLYNHWRKLPVVATGGGWSDAAVSTIMRPVLENAGVPPAMISTEEQSTSTYENAYFTAALLRQRGLQKIALVTEAYHMLRSEQSFRKQGLDVLPAPSNYRAVPFRFTLGNLLPSAKAILTNDDALHEWIGLLWYKASGKV